mmetsp:Transcript_53119/g.123815  ORF Transcript_53119/g.123815 Transcript_53119/m.123815 type:complete len:302 (+) Transcript_53119:296-1201(+)
MTQLHRSRLRDRVEQVKGSILLTLLVISAQAFGARRRQQRFLRAFGPLTAWIDDGWTKSAVGIHLLKLLIHLLRNLGVVPRGTWPRSRTALVRRLWVVLWLLLDRLLRCFGGLAAVTFSFLRCPTPLRLLLLLSLLVLVTSLLLPLLFLLHHTLVCKHLHVVHGVIVRTPPTWTLQYWRHKLCFTPTFLELFQLLLFDHVEHGFHMALHRAGTLWWTCRGSKRAGSRFGSLREREEVAWDLVLEEKFHDVLRKLDLLREAVVSQVEKLLKLRLDLDHEDAKQGTFQLHRTEGFGEGLLLRG